MKDYADRLLSACRLRRYVAHREDVPGRPARHGELGLALQPAVAGALERNGIRRLYSHQAEAIRQALACRPVLVVTPTASGKSLVYHLPVLEACARDSGTRALYLFPFKALEQDQKASFERLAAAFPEADRPRCAIYDGDTPPARRRSIRAKPPHVLITNPDMLHLGLLAHHASWASFFAGLRYVVVDELHVYRGVFGSHLHHIVQRLRRLCRLYGSDPVFVAASATVGEPSRLARDLLCQPVAVVDESGAPRAARHFVFLQPGLELSPYTVAMRLMARTLADGQRTITFTKARRIAELIHSWLLSSDPGLRGKVTAYRAGYLPEERRTIERDLARGRLLGVISTSALELGVDIGGLDVCIMVGYPGSITSAWQRVGRVGRQDRVSLILLVGMPDALDQFFLTHPQEFFHRPFEPVVLDPANREVASAHLVCAGAESPLTPEDSNLYGQAIFDLIPGLVREGRLLRDAGAERWSSLRRAPQWDVGLRSLGRSFTIFDAASGREMGCIDAMRAPMECHGGAIYLHRGHTYRIRELDLEGRRVLAEPAFDADHFTVVLTEKETEIIEECQRRRHRPFAAGLGRLRVTTRFRGYLRKRLADRKVLSEHPLDLPPAEFETVGLWVELPGGLAQVVAGRRGHFMGGIHGIEHAAIGLFPLLALCDRADLGGISYVSHPQVGGPAFFIYDGHPGGMGLAAEGYRRIRELLARTRQLLAACPCQGGCPSCVQSPKCGNGNRPLDKETALYLLQVLTGLEEAPGAVAAGAPRRTVPSRPAPAAAARSRSSNGSPSPPTTGRRRPEVDLVFDLETLRSAADVGGWDRAAEMGLALAVVHDRRNQTWRTYREAEAKDLIIDLLGADRVIGFNVKRFDYAVLSGYSTAELGRIPTLDLLEEIHAVLGFRLSLARLAEGTLGLSKGGDGLASLEWVKEGRWDLVEAYCRRDVEITLKLFDYGRRHGHLLARDRQGRSLQIPAGWS
ncbi:MAG: DEAD/DEAH box helicase [Acidobacteriota bacterium]